MEPGSGTHAACGNCGADIPVPPAGGLVVCEFCKSSLYVEARGTVRHFLYRPSVKLDEVGSHLNRWLFATGEKDTTAQVLSCKLVYYPFWRRERGAHVALVPASASPEGPLDDIQSPSGELVAMDPAARDLATLVPAASPPPTGTGGEDPGGAGVWLVHVPVYHVTYELSGREDVVLVEATAGKAIASTAPAGTLGRSSGNDGLALAAGAVLLVAIGGFVPWSWAALAGWLVVGAGVFLLLSRAGARGAS